MAEPVQCARFFQNRACEYFPCHAGVDEQDFNCLFCFCPLYALGRHCGGNFCYTAAGTKDCSGCTFPHRRENYAQVLARWDDIRALAALADGVDGWPPAGAANGAGEKQR